MAAMICHGALSRFPDLKIMSIENGCGFVRPVLHQLAETYRMMPQELLEDPVEVFKRNVYVSPFHEEDIQGLIGLLGADHVLFGSDYPHPEGKGEPLSILDELEGLPREDIVKIMGGNMSELMGVGVAA